MTTTLFYNGPVLTMDPANPAGKAMLVEGNKIVMAVNDYQQYLNNDGMQKIDISGRTILPGFNDNHIHLNFFGESLASPNFAGMNEKGIVDLLKERYPNPQKNEIIYGQSWDYPACPNPKKEILDKAFPDNPVILSQYGGHCVWVNSVTLNKMNLTGRNQKNNAVKAVTDDSGEYTGIIRDIGDNAFIRKWHMSRLLNKKLLKLHLTAALKECVRYGITSVQDNTWSYAGVSVLNSMLKKNELTARISCWEFGSMPLFRFLFKFQKFDKKWLSRGPVKFFSDGTFSSRTAWLSEPYKGEPGNYGFGKNAEELKRIMTKEIKRKKQAGFHTIGDRAVEEYLNAIEELFSAYSFIPKLRFRLEHAQLIRPDDMARLKRFGVLVAAQPSALVNPEKDRQLLGESRALKAYPYRSLIDYGVPLSFGSDAPAENIINPFDGVHFAVNREGPEKISAEEAVRCYTAGSAYAENKENVKGALAPGMLADFIIVSDNPLEIDSRQLKNIKVLNTYVDGREAYNSEKK